MALGYINVDVELSVASPVFSYAIHQVLKSNPSESGPQVCERIA
jgi:hypothetical protein